MTTQVSSQSGLMAAVYEVAASLGLLLVRSGRQGAGTSTSPGLWAGAKQEARSNQEPSALERVCTGFGLTSFERKILLMCAGVELDSDFANLCAALHQDSRGPLPTFSIALAAFDDAHWSALSPDAPLRRWKLIEMLAGDSYTTSPLRIQERVLHYLAGVPCMDERLRVVLQPVREAGALAPSQQVVAQQMAAIWSQPIGNHATPIIQLCGDGREAKRAVATWVSRLFGLTLYSLSAQSVPQSSTDLDQFLRLWEREFVLNPCCLLIELDEGGFDALSEGMVNRILESVESPILVSSRNLRPLRHRSIVTVTVANPTSAEQAELWRDVLRPVIPCLNGEVTALVAQFSLSSETIRSAANAVLAPEARDAAPVPGVVDRLWDACRTHARPRLEGLAQRIAPAASWDDLVLPEKQASTLRLVATHVRQRARVYETWGFASKTARGLGISALFAGPSGTGKTMAAEVLANELRLDLFRIDLSQVVNKYIGETEKNLASVFDAAEQGAAILLFDEADALFGKRSDVKDSHDRYANIEVSYLLQRMEEYRGLAILTTNRKMALDQAFLRRIRFVVEFPFPEAAERAEIWRRVFPGRTPTEDLRYDRLSRLNVSGGHIRNIAMSAAFLAADAGEPVRMSHLLSAARTEFIKLEKPLTDGEIAGWN